MKIKIIMTGKEIKRKDYMRGTPAYRLKFKIIAGAFAVSWAMFTVFL